MADDQTHASVKTPGLLGERACFDGVLLATLCYGALVMLYIQLTQVLIRKPKRGKAFWAIVGYSAVLFPLATVAIGGMLRVNELAYIDNRDFPGGPIAWIVASRTSLANVLSRAATMLIPWFGDALMLYRLMVVWDYHRGILIVPAAIYLSKIAISIPFLLSATRASGTHWAHRYPRFSLVFYIVCLAFNTVVTICIMARMISMKGKVKSALGALQASYYTSSITLFVESGAFFTLWSLSYLVLRAIGNHTQPIFLEPFVQVEAVVRMLIILRIAQDRAWSKDIVTASARGILDWQVSSANSLSLQDIHADGVKALPKKYQEDVMPL